MTLAEAKAKIEELREKYRKESDPDKKAKIALMGRALRSAYEEVLKSENPLITLQQKINETS